MSKADRAEELFRMGYNCSQSDLCSFCRRVWYKYRRGGEKSQSIWSQDSENFGSVRRCDGDDYGTWRVIWI